MENLLLVTHSGTLINPVELSDNQININDIAHALSMQCRYNGHTEHFYSVAQHSVLVAAYIMREHNDPRLALAALLHDAHEAYLGDMIRPIKDMFPEFVTLEKILQARIWGWAGLFIGLEGAARINDVDRAIVANEYKAVFQECAARNWPDNFIGLPLPTAIKPWAAADAKKNFLKHFNRYWLQIRGA